MPIPEPGDVLIRDTVFGYIVVDAVGLRELSGPYRLITGAFVAARESSTGHIWRESVDRRGRPLGHPFVLELPSSSLADSAPSLS